MPENERHQPHQRAGLLDYHASRQRLDCRHFVQALFDGAGDLFHIMGAIFHRQQTPFTGLMHPRRRVQRLFEIAIAGRALLLKRFVGIRVADRLVQLDHRRQRMAVDVIHRRVQMDVIDLTNHKIAPVPQFA